MSSPYQGNAANVTQYSPSTITSATNASPIAITTSAAHNYATGDTVVISGVGGNTAANGRFVITVTGSTTFTLNGSTGSGAYTSGGTAKDANLLPYASLPSNGDIITVDQMNAFLQNLADKVQFTALNLFTNRVVAINTFALTSNVGILNTTPLADVAGFTMSFAVVAGDQLSVDALAIYTASASGVIVTMDLAFVDGGTTYKFGCVSGVAAANATDQLSRAMNGVYTVLNTGTITVKLQAFLSSGTALFLGSATQNSGLPSSRIRVVQYRP